MVKYEDLQLLQRYALAQYDAAAAGLQAVQMDLDRNRVTESTAYRKLRRWFLDMDKAGKAKARTFLRDGIAKLTGKIADDDHGDARHGEVGSGGDGGGVGDEGAGGTGG